VHIKLALVVALTVGKEFTVTELTALLVDAHPAALIPVTVYDALAVGLTTAEPDEKE
jgi:hypothetical protein